MVMSDLIHVQDQLRCKFKRQRTGDPAWERYFITIPHVVTKDDEGDEKIGSVIDLQIGRISVHKGQIYSTHHYKKTWWDDPIDDGDRVICKIDYFRRTGQVIDNFEEIEAQVLEECRLDREAKLEARRLLETHDLIELGRKRKRSKIVGKDPRRHLYNVIGTMP